jgi:hypothetical protein
MQEKNLKNPFSRNKKGGASRRMRRPAKFQIEGHDARAA